MRVTPEGTSPQNGPGDVENALPAPTYRLTVRKLQNLVGDDPNAATNLRFRTTYEN
jgi:hypothetical protein